MQTNASTLYLIYDGECILCKNTALALRIKDAVGTLEIINARENDREAHPIVTEAVQAGYNLNEGILVKFHGKYYYGAEALHFLALIGSPMGLLNKFNVLIFRSKFLVKFFYPILKFIRDILLFVRGTSPISLILEIKQPLSKLLFGDRITQLPQILQRRYSVIPYSNDYLSLTGTIDTNTLRVLHIFAPIFRFMGSLPFYSAQNIHIIVEFICKETSNKIEMNRTFYHHDKPNYHFNSKIIHIKDNIVLELMKFNLAVKLLYRLELNKIIIDYGGYFLCIGSRLIPLPLGWIIGKFSAYEEAINETEFNMEVSLHHPIFGKIYHYKGKFGINFINE